MINFHKPIAGGFTVGIMVMYVLAMSAPVLAKGPSLGQGWRRFARFTGAPSAARFSGRLRCWSRSWKRLLHLPQTSHQCVRQYHWISSCAGLQLRLGR